MSKAFVELDTPWCMRIACCITKVTDTRSEYVILIAFPLQKWVYERASILRYMYVAYLVYKRDFAYVMTKATLLVTPWLLVHQYGECIGLFKIS
jgi:hypothetical protein